MGKRRPFNHSHDGDDEEKPYAHADRNGQQNGIYLIFYLSRENCKIRLGNGDENTHNKTYGDKNLYFF